ncbi:hypothetical protein WR25_25742 [Diploscapter pachys]|uniref:Uncharacterized protein n=1 Tax=Diploscapter pachys TaxID=2018661 RepID=A0A2A2JDL6_9BILA|nr:hypothetical protein WR25_25742 [Diploscapter pachys]
MAPYSSQPGPSSNFRLARPVIQKSETVTETVRYQRRSEPMTGPRAVEKDPYSGPIPRIRTKQLSVSQNNNIDKEPNRQEVVGSKKKGRSKNYDTFDENAIETIYDEFKFLDENDVPSPSSSSARPILSRKNNKTWKPTPSLIAYCLLALIQLVVSVAILVLAALRANNLYRRTLVFLPPFVRRTKPCPWKPRLDVSFLQSCKESLLYADSGL